MEDRKKAQALIPKQETAPKFSFFDMMESYLDQRIAGLIAEMKPKDGIDGKDGEDAITPIKGKDYFTKDDLNELEAQLRVFIDKNIPKKGVHYFDGINGKDGYSPIKGIDYFDGEDGISISPEEIREMVKTSTKSIKTITPDDIEKLIKKHITSTHDKLSQSIATLRGDVMRNYGGHGGSGGTGSATNRDVFIATNNQTVFTASMTVKSDIQVSESGTILTPSVDYTDTTTTLTLTVGVPAGTVVIWYYNI